MSGTGREQPNKNSSRSSLLLTPPALQAYLRSFERLRSVELSYRTDLQAQIAPHLVTLRGAVPIHGRLHVYEAELNLLDFQSRLDLERLVKALHKSIDEASCKSN